MKIMIRIFMAVCICFMTLVPVQARSYQKWSFTLADGSTITADEYHEKTIVFIFYSAETDAEGNAVDTRSAEVLKYLSTDPFGSYEGVMTVAAAAENKDPAEVDALIERYGRCDNIYYAYNAQEEMMNLNLSEEFWGYTLCILYDGGIVRKSFDCASIDDYEEEVKYDLENREPRYFDIHLKITYHQDYAREMLDLINEFRTGDETWCWNEDDTEKIYYENLNTLVYDYELEKAAMQRAAELAMLFGHMRHDNKSCRHTVFESGYPEEISTAENCYMGSAATKSPSYAMKVLKETDKNYYNQGHRRNMLAEDHVSCAIGCAEYEGSYYYVQIFSESAVGTVPVSANTETEIRTIHCSNHYLINWKMKNETLNIEPGTTGNISKINSLMIASYTMKGGSDRYHKTEESLNWTSSNEDVISVNGDSFTAKKTGTAVLTAFTPDPSISVQFTVNVKDEDEGPIITPEPTPAVKTVEMYRLYNPNSGEHFYTAKSKERDALVKVGWKYEGIGWYAPETSKTPVYRLYNENAGDHHYTMKKAERDALIKIGWKDEKIGWYSDDNEEVPLYRQYNPYAVSGSHNYTTNKKENDALVKIGWIAEGIGWYGVKH